MTVSSTTNRKTYAGDAVTTSFATSPLVFYASSELAVSVSVDATGVSTTLVENTGYTVSGGGGLVGTINTSAGSAPYGAVASGSTLLIVRTLPLTQAVDLVNGNVMDAEVVETAFDKQTMVSQQLSAVQGRSLTQPDADVTDIGALPIQATRASSYLAFDTNGDPIASVGTGTASPISAAMEPVVEAATLAAARTALGSTTVGDAVFVAASAAAARTASEIKSS